MGEVATSSERSSAAMPRTNRAADTRTSAFDTAPIGTRTGVALPERLLQGPSHQHLRELATVFGACKRIRGRARALVGSLGRGRRVGSSPERFLDAARTDRGLPH